MTQPLDLDTSARLPARHCDNCDNPMTTWRTITIGVVDFHLCARCDAHHQRNGAALASFYRQQLEQAQQALAATTARAEAAENALAAAVERAEGLRRLLDTAIDYLNSESMWEVVDELRAKVEALAARTGGQNDASNMSDM